ncbi:MAG: Pyruvate ferredoxin/flavodoxin oxidoreductase, delta subunit [Clostridia bacterium 41_269]|nr:MAG: Pyruvate ferredoxin/flavodoxin oxidoreductase, delta subunit [Clostridia bacterium 41_269]
MGLRAELLKLYEELPFAGTYPSPKTENDKQVTGNWKVQRPVLDTEKCTQCWQCWIFCADAIITRGENGPEFFYKYCKGCGVCANECPTGAITMVPELEFED